MNITIKINTDNAAFQGNAGEEVARVLRELAARLDESDYVLSPGYTTPARDFNGNTVGQLKVTK